MRLYRLALASAPFGLPANNQFFLPTTKGGLAFSAALLSGVTSACWGYPVFNEIYGKYLADVSAIDLSRVSCLLGIEVDGDTAIIPFYGIPHRVSGKGVMDDSKKRPIHAVSVILCKYLFLCPKEKPAVVGEWIRYHNFKDAAPFAGGFRNTAEQPISKAFSGRVEDLEKACIALGGYTSDAPIDCDLAIKFPALPGLNLLMLFNDQDDEFPADCSILFEKQSDTYLDMECLAMLGMVLAVWLKNGPDYREGNI